jgi:hypothetical protein
LDIQLTLHARAVMEERKIENLWLLLALDSPDRTIGQEDGTIHYLRKIPDFGGRWLRVVLNPATEPSRRPL